MNILDLPQEILEIIISKCDKQDLQNFSNVSKICKHISKKFLSAEILREYLENNWIFMFNPEDCFENRGKVLEMSRKEKKYFYVSKSSPFLDALNLG